jgi:hypothetical protein
MADMDTKQVVNLLLNKEIEITNKIHQAVSQIMRLGYESERGKKEIPDLIDSIQYTLEDLERIVNR